MTENAKPAARGRPEVPENERRSVLLQFRVTESEAKVIKRKAEKSGQSVSDWLRDAVST